MLRDIEFKARISDYESVVNGIRDGKIPCVPDANHDFAEIDSTKIKNLPLAVGGILACRCDDAKVVVLFGTSRYDGLIFVDPEKLCKGGNELMKNIILDPIAKNWYRFSALPDSPVKEKS